MLHAACLSLAKSTSPSKAAWPTGPCECAQDPTSIHRSNGKEPRRKIEYRMVSSLVFGLWLTCEQGWMDFAGGLQHEEVSGKSTESTKPLQHLRESPETREGYGSHGTGSEIGCGFASRAISNLQKEHAPGSSRKRSDTFLSSIQMTRLLWTMDFPP